MYLTSRPETQEPSVEERRHSEEKRHSNRANVLVEELGPTALHLAIVCKNIQGDQRVEKCKQLLNRKADPDARDEVSRPPRSDGSV